MSLFEIKKSTGALFVRRFSTWAWAVRMYPFQQYLRGGSGTTKVRFKHIYRLY